MGVEKNIYIQKCIIARQQLEQRRGDEEEEVGFLLYKLNLHLLYPGKSYIEYKMSIEEKVFN